jgi:hypothetical protein
MCEAVLRKFSDCVIFATPSHCIIPVEGREGHHGQTRLDRARRQIRWPLSGGRGDHRRFHFHPDILRGRYARRLKP